jgi:hypothetical protein
MLFHLADNGNAESAASRLRCRRVRKFAGMLRFVQSGVRILDAGGTGQFWERYREELPARSVITVLNRSVEPQPEFPWLRYVPGDARHMDMFQDCEFDVCFSNSVIEHVGRAEDQARMAAEIRRVARGYFVQTPYAYFPLEPHFLVPGWQFAPIAWRTLVLQRRDLGWMKRVPDPREARAVVESIRLLNTRQMQQLFPDGQIYREKIAGFTKSITAWRPPS